MIMASKHAGFLFFSPWHQVAALLGGLTIQAISRTQNSGNRK